MDALSPVATILLLKKSQKCFFLCLCYHLRFVLRSLSMCLLFCMLRGINSKEIGEEILFPSFFRKMLMSAFLLRFKANYLAKCVTTPIFLFGFQ